MIPSQERTRHTFEEKMTSTKARNTMITIKSVLNNFEKFSQEKFNQQDIIPDLKVVSEDTLWDTLQQWIIYNSAKSPSTIKQWFTIVRKYLHYRGIKLNPDDVTENLDFPRKITEELHSLQISEIRKILSASGYKKRVLYVCQISSGMRIGELVQLRKKHLVMGKKRIIVKIPSQIAKFNKARTTFLSIEAQNLLMPILRKKQDDELVFGSNDDMRKAEVNEMQTLKRTIEKVGLYQKNQSNGRSTITSHSFRAYFITKLSRHDSNFAKKLAGQKGYLLQYDRLSDDEKLEMYLKFEHYLLIDDSITAKIENNTQKSLLRQMGEMKTEIEELKYGLTGRMNMYNEKLAKHDVSSGTYLVNSFLSLAIELGLSDEKKVAMMKEFELAKKENREPNLRKAWNQPRMSKEQVMELRKLLERYKNAPPQKQKSTNGLPRYRGKEHLELLLAEYD